MFISGSEGISEDSAWSFRDRVSGRNRSKRFGPPVVCVRIPAGSYACRQGDEVDVTIPDGQVSGFPVPSDISFKHEKGDWAPASGGSSTAAHAGTSIPPPAS